MEELIYKTKSKQRFGATNQVDIKFNELIKQEIKAKMIGFLMDMGACPSRDCHVLTCLSCTVQLCLLQPFAPQDQLQTPSERLSLFGVYIVV